MKNTTLLIALVLATFTVHAQQTSFESSEGYTSGELVDGVNGWEETTAGSNYFYVSDDRASDGANALKLSSDPNHPQVFAHWTFPEALPLDDNLEISMDVYVPGDDTTLYWKVMSNDAYAAYIIIQEEYVFPAKVTVVNPVPLAMAAINVGAFNEIKLAFNYTDETITYYANGEEIHQSEMWGSNEAIDQYAFEGFLWQDTYMDNFQVDGVLSTQRNKDIPFIHYVQNNTLNIESTVAMEAIEIYNVLGKRIYSENVQGNRASIAISPLNSGVYIAVLKTKDQRHSFKFVKQN